MFHLLVLLAATGHGLTIPTDWGPYVQWGVLGVVVIAFSTDKIVTGKKWQLERDRADAYEKTMQERVIPAMENYSAVIKEALATINAVKGDMDRDTVRALENLLVEHRRLGVIDHDPDDPPPQVVRRRRAP